MKSGTMARQTPGNIPGTIAIGDGFGGRTPVRFHRTAPLVSGRAIVQIPANIQERLKNMQHSRSTYPSAEKKFEAVSSLFLAAAKLNPECTASISTHKYGKNAKISLSGKNAATDKTETLSLELELKKGSIYSLLSINHSSVYGEFVFSGNDTSSENYAFDLMNYFPGAVDNDLRTFQKGHMMF